MLRAFAICLAGYILGSLPFPYLVVRMLTGQDIRHVGNGNMGTRNVIRVAGLGPGLVALLLESGKGALAYGVARWSGATELTVYLCGLAVVVGHWFPIWLRFRGGIGQGAATGYFCAMWPVAAAVGVPVFVLGRLVIPYFNGAYVLAAVAFLAVGLARGREPLDAAFMVVILALVVAKKLVDAPRQRHILETEAGTTTGDKGRHETSVPERTDE